MPAETDQNNPSANVGRRDFLRTTGASVALAGFPFLSRAASMSHDAIVRLNLADGVEALRSGTISSTDYCMAAMEQAAKFKDHNIFTQMSPSYVQGTAAAVDGRRKDGDAIGQLQGIPYALKDSVDMVEYYTIAGHPSLKTFEPTMDADLVKIYKEADAICIGKTQIPALSLWWTTENPMTGDTGNPFNRAYKTGGSSGGSGAAVAARIVPFAVAEDTGGSVRVPAGVNGVQGLRPTTGRWPSAGAMPIGFSDTLGPIARSVADIKFLDTLCAVDHPENAAGRVNLKNVRVGYQREGFFDELHPWVQENAERSMSVLSAAGATLVEVKGLPFAETSAVAIQMLLADMPASMAHYFNRHRVYDRSAFGLMHELHMEGLKKAWLPGMNNAPTGEAYFELVEKLMVARDAYEKLMSDNNLDVLFYPTTKVPNTPNDGGNVMAGPGPLGEMLPELQIGANMLFAPAMRTPSISLYSGMDSAGLPLSVTFDGFSGEDRKLLDVAEAIENVMPRLAEPKSI